MRPASSIAIATAVTTAATVAATLALATVAIAGTTKGIEGPGWLPFALSLAGSGPSVRGGRPTSGNQQQRDLHEAAFEHNHIYRPPFADDLAGSAFGEASTGAPTTWYEFDDDEYNIDDGAIDEAMIEGRKDLYERERSDPSDSSGIGGSDGGDQTVETAQALQGSGAAGGLPAGALAVLLPLLVGLVPFC